MNILKIEVNEKINTVEGGWRYERPVDNLIYANKLVSEDMGDRPDLFETFTQMLVENFLNSLVEIKKNERLSQEND